VKVPTGRLSALPLVQQSANRHVHIEPNGGVAFDTEGWYEVSLRVDWDPDDVTGTRFAHTKISDQEPLHS